MPTELSFFAAFIVGLLGSTHCIGMCSGIVGVLSVGMPRSSAGFSRWQLLYHLAYNAGRISSYMVAGALAGFAGAGIRELTPATGWPVGQLIAAMFMIALGLYLGNWWRALVFLEKLGARFWLIIKPLGLRFLPVKNPRQAFALGLVWGWLPCGLVYSVVAWSMTSGDWFTGTQLMLGFGLGTLPALLFVGGTMGKFNFLRNTRALRTIAGILMISMGIYSVVSSLAPGHLDKHVEQGDTIENLQLLTRISQAGGTDLWVLYLTPGTDLVKFQ